MNRIVAVIHARMSSSRLPGKILKKVAGKTVFSHHVERMRQVQNIHKIVLGTSRNPNNEPLINEAQSLNIDTYAGSEEDVVGRYLAIAEKENADVLVRCGGDKPLFSYEIVNHLASTYNGEDVLFAANPLGKGVGSELISYEALKRIHDHYRGPAITKYAFEYPHLFSLKGMMVDDELSRPEFRLTLDTSDDLRLIRKIYDVLYKPGHPVDLREVFRFLDDNPTLANINRFAEEKEINTYFREIEKLPVVTIYRVDSGKYIARNRMGELIPKNEVEGIIPNILDSEL